jgi:hypothetical protein
MRACSAGNSSSQTVAKSASRIVTSRSVISSPSRLVAARCGRPTPARRAASGRGRAPHRRRRRPARWSPGRCRSRPRSLAGHVVAVDPAASSGVARRLGRPFGPKIRPLRSAGTWARVAALRRCAGSAMTACALSHPRWSTTAACSRVGDASVHRLAEIDPVAEYIDDGLPPGVPPAYRLPGVVSGARTLNSAQE